jgi:uncharacterized protein (TIGR03382 family)
VPLDLPEFDRPVTLTGAAARIPLPTLGELGAGARIDFADGDIQELPITNRGEGPLSIEAYSAPPGISVGSIMLEPGAKGSLRVVASPGALVPGETVTLLLATNDPDHGTLDVSLGIDVGGDDPGDVDDPGAGGCSASGAGGGAASLVLVGLAALIARRRQGARLPV